MITRSLFRTHALAILFEWVPSVLIGHVCLHLTSIFIPLDKKDGVNCRTMFLRCSAYGSERDISCNLDSMATLIFSESLIPIEKSEY